MKEFKVNNNTYFFLEKSITHRLSFTVYSFVIENIKLEKQSGAVRFASFYNKNGYSDIEKIVLESTTDDKNNLLSVLGDDFLEKNKTNYFGIMEFVVSEIVKPFIKSVSE